MIVGHPVTNLADEAWFNTWFAAASIEALIVAYADKRAGQKLEAMADRFASWESRYPPDPRTDREGVWSVKTLAAVRKRAGILEARVCWLAGVAPEDVRRLEWTSAAIREARPHPAKSAGPALAGRP